MPLVLPLECQRLAVHAAPHREQVFPYHAFVGRAAVPRDTPDKRKGEQPIEEAAREAQPEKIRDPREVDPSREDREREEAEKGKA